jgi:hypothetical protein
MDNMSSYSEQLRARIAEKRRQLEEIKSANLFPISGSVNAAAVAMQELRRQISVDEKLLAQYSNR